MAMDMDQKPPITTPSRARPTIRTAKFGARATTAPDNASRRENVTIRALRSIRRVTPATTRLVTTANRPEMEIA